MSPTIFLRCRLSATVLLSLCFADTAIAGENLFGFVKGAETLPENAMELYQIATVRSGKGQGSYQAIDYATEVEYGVSDKFTIDGSLKMMSLDTEGLIINAYLPKDNKFSLKPSGVEAEATYMFVSPALHPLGYSMQVGFDYSWIDPHSGQDKDSYSVELSSIVQKYMLEGQLIWGAHASLESTYASRAAIDDLPEDFEWPTDPEMEIEYSLGTGLSYRFAPKWFVSVEAFYQTEWETEVGQERWSLFAGPSLHYGSEKWWGTITWLPQLKGGGERYEGQKNTDLHLIEKTEQELRLKMAFNF